MTQVPASRQPVVEQGPAGASLFTRAWFLFFQRLANSGQDASPVTVGASPFTYDANDSGLLIITGGTVSLIEYGRNSTFTNTGLISGIVPLADGDRVRITYTVVPTVTFIRK